jgi:hypothetical protein
MRKGGLRRPCSAYFLSISILSSAVVSLRQVLEIIICLEINDLRHEIRYIGY